MANLFGVVESEGCEEGRGEEGGVMGVKGGLQW